MLNNINLNELSKIITKIIFSCIVLYIAFTNLDVIGNILSWIISKFSPFILGGMIAIMLNIPMTLIEKQYYKKHNKDIKRALSIILSLLCTIGLLIVIVAIVLPELYHATKVIIEILVNTLNELTNPNYADSEILVLFKSLGIDLVSLQAKLESWIQFYSRELVSKLLFIFKDTANIVVTFCIGLVFSIYLLGNKEILASQVKRLMNAWLPNKTNKIILHISTISINTFNQFIVSQVTEAIILGSLCGIGMAILRIPYPFMVGVFIGVTALVPYFGAVAGELVGFIVILAVDPFKALVFMIYILILQQIEGNIIYPKVVGSKIKLPPIWVFSSIIIGGNILGPLGMFFAVPTTSIIYELVKEATRIKEQENLERSLL
ncbi:MAG: AI-2E family transporter [Erysipelotrichales bacterium]|nr:AI-2E family transporter [Erysipelotrichales bacterium]